MVVVVLIFVWAFNLVFFFVAVFFMSISVVLFIILEELLVVWVCWIDFSIG